MIITLAGQSLHPSDFDSIFVRLSGIKVLWNQVSPVGSGDRLWQSQTRLPEGHDAFRTIWQERALHMLHFTVGTFS